MQSGADLNNFWIYIFRLWIAGMNTPFYVPSFSKQTITNNSIYKALKKVTLLMF